MKTKFGTRATNRILGLQQPREKKKTKTPQSVGGTPGKAKAQKGKKTEDQSEGGKGSPEIPKLKTLRTVGKNSKKP